MKTFADARTTITQDAKRQRQNLTTFQRQFPGLPEFLAGFESENCRVSWSHSYGGSINITLNNLAGFKDERLAHVLERLMDYFPTAIWDSRDFGQNTPWRSYNAVVRWRSNGLGLDIAVEAHVRADSPTCRRVVVGHDTQTVVTPVYETICE